MKSEFLESYEQILSSIETLKNMKVSDQFLFEVKALEWALWGVREEAIHQKLL